MLMLPAFAAGLLILTSHVIMGRQVLRRGIIFIDLAIAQIAALGAVAAVTVPWLMALAWVQWWLPLLFALVGALFIAGLERIASAELEALIGSLYVLSAALAVLLLSHDPHGHERLGQLLSGQILWINWSDLRLPTLLTGAFLGLWYWRPDWLNGRAFYPIFAVMITWSVAIVGIYLVFASLILPALAINRLGLARLRYGYGIGALSYGLGLLASFYWDLPAGSTIVALLVLHVGLVRGGWAWWLRLRQPLPQC